MITKTIPLNTERLLLRKITMDDIEPMYNNWASDDDVTRFLNWSTHQNIEVTRHVVSSWINQYNHDYFFQWIIEHKDNKEVLGTISLFNRKEESYEIGYCISKKYWNQGITSEACRAVLNFAFTELNVKSINSRHVAENIASGRVMQKNNMRFIGSSNEYIPSKSNLVIMNKYIITREEFK